jgi:hypothetical protein
MLERELRELRELPACGADAAAYIGSVREILACGERDRVLMLIARLSALGEAALRCMEEQTIIGTLKRDRREAVAQGLIADPSRSVEDRAAELMGKYASLLEIRARARRGATPMLDYDSLDLAFQLPETLADMSDLHSRAHDAACANGAAYTLLCRVSMPTVDPDRQLAVMDALNPILQRVEAELGAYPTDVDDPRRANPGAALSRWRSALDKPLAWSESDIWIERAAASVVVLAVTENTCGRSVLGRVGAQAAARLGESPVFDHPSRFDTACVFGRSTELVGLMACNWLQAQCDGKDGRNTVMVLTDHLRALVASTTVGAWAAAART